MTAATATADLAIVGGGVLGCFTAYTAARSHPHWHVVLLERASIGAGATGWSAGVSFPLAATARHRDLVRASAAAYATLDSAIAGQCVRPLTMIYVVGRDREPAFRERVVDAVLRPTTAEESARVATMLPDLRLGPDEVLLTHDGQGFAVDARALAEALASTGVDVRVGQTVRAVHRHDDGYRLVTEPAEVPARPRGQSVQARRVVMACGPWPGPDVAPVPLAQPPTARRKRVAALHVALPVGPDDPLVYFVDDDLFLLPLAHGSALASFYRDEWDTDPDSVDGRPSEEDLRAGREVLRRRSAAAAEAVTGGRAFCDLYTEDRLPVVTCDPALPGLAAIRGGSGSGVRLAPALAEEALRAVESRTPSTV